METNVETIPKKTAAIEVYKVHSRAQYIAVIGIIASILLPATVMFGLWGASLTSFICAVFFIILMAMSMREKKRLAETYGIE